MTDEHPGTEELAQRLEAYAAVRLAPRRGAAARIRANLIEEARMQALEASLARRRSRLAIVRRRVVPVLLAAALTIGAAAGVAAASSAGGPLYGARVWVETTLLPSDASARALERIHQIDERVLEIERAVQSGDSNAVAAAIAAYRDAVQAALNEVGSDQDRLAHLKAALGLHVTVLETLAGEVPPQALSGITNAIDSSQNAVDRIDHTKPDGSKPGGKPAATPAPGATDKPGKGHAPTDPPAPPSTDPHPTVAPAPTPNHTPGH